MKVWITGCGGFLGNRLAQRLTASGHAVYGLSRRRSDHVTESIKVDLAADSARTTLTEISERAGHPDVVVHAASRQPGNYNLSDYVRANVLTTANLMDALANFPPRLLLYTSTQSVYGQPKTNPVPETQLATSSMPYNLTKRWAEQLVEGLSGQARIIVLRLPSLYGAGQADSFIDGLAKRALLDQPIELFSRGELIRDALHVSDIVNAITACAENPFEGSFSILNLGCGRCITTLEYATTLVAALQSKSVIIPVDRPATQPGFYADIEKARRVIGFEPKSLEESMRVYAEELST